MFDKVEIRVRGGNGGDGAITFRREAYVPYGGPDGGDGGHGGDLIVRADQGVTSLGGYIRKRLYKAGDGDRGGNKKKYGKHGTDLVLSVPVGTIVWDESNHEMLEDLDVLGEQVVVAKGGKGGWGNSHYATATNQAPRLAQKGEQGDEKTILLELRLIADVGIIGYPNAGKSTLLAAASAAKPKIASYPFTTLEPIQGIVEVDDKRFTLAEIPGIIEDAHLGKGLGFEFLRHAMRTKVLVHLVDGTSPTPVDEMMKVNHELSSFDATVARKPQLIAVNKIDIPEVAERMPEIEEEFAKQGIIVRFVSAVTGKGVKELMVLVARALDQEEARAEKEKPAPVVFRPAPGRRHHEVRKEGDVFVIEAPDLQRMVARIDLTDPEIVGQLRQHIIRIGIGRALEKAGVHRGDLVRSGEIEWEW